MKNEKCIQAWVEISEKNFHRSLDHRTFTFKKNDKKQFNSQQMEIEAE